MEGSATNTVSGTTVVPTEKKEQRWADIYDEEEVKNEQVTESHVPPIVPQKITTTPTSTTSLELKAMMVKASVIRRWWDSRDLYFRGNHPPLNLAPGSISPSLPAIEWLQLNRMITELQLLTSWWDSVPNGAVVLYIGSEPFNHLQVLAPMFPMVQWHIYNHNGHNVAPSNQLKLYREYFTDQTASLWAGYSQQLVLISGGGDTLQLQIQKSEVASTPEEIEMQQQHRLMELINPPLALLRFTPPLGTQGMMHYNYFNGHLLYRSFNGSSHETALVPVKKDGFGPYHDVKYDLQQYHGRLNYHNAIVRTSYKYYVGTLEDGSSIDNYDILHLMSVVGNYLQLVEQISTKYTEDNVSRFTISLAQAILQRLEGGEGRKKLYQLRAISHPTNA